MTATCHDSWRDRAQEATVRAESAEAAIERVRHLLDATDPNRYAILSMEGLRMGIRSALDGCPPRDEGSKPHCPDCSGIVGETGVAW